MDLRGCGHENPVGAKFCATCGTAIGRDCESCGASLTDGAAFCTSCGAPASDASLEPSVVSKRFPPDAAPAPSDGFSVPLVGERRRLTVMFCDLVGSTSIAAQLDPEVYGELMDTYYQVCGDVIRRYKGFVSQYLGDGILALFGYPEAGETTAEDAVDASLEILRDLNDRHVGTSGIKMTARVGVHSGLVVVTEVGAPDRRETHVLGDAVNVAARVQALAEPNSVVVTDELKRRLEDAFAFDPLGARDLKGVPEPVLVHRVIRRVPASRRPPGRPSGAFVGRRAELSQLADRWRGGSKGRRTGRSRAR